MDTRSLLEILSVAEKLKCNTRHCYTSSGRHESVAEHCWRTALFAMLIEDEFPEADINKVIKMCLIHDMGEAFTGDIPVFEKRDKDEDVESRVLSEWLKTLPCTIREEWELLYQEMEALESLEARIYKALDKLEALIQHNESDISTWIPLEYTLQLEYGWENVKFSQYFTNLRQIVADDSRNKMKD